MKVWSDYLLVLAVLGDGHCSFDVMQNVDN